GAGTGGGGGGGGGGATGGAGGGGGGATGGTGGVIWEPPQETDFTEDVGGVLFEMVYVPGGTFTIGCESGSCPADTAPVSGVTVSGYHIGKAEVTAELWKAVMGESSSTFGGPESSYTSMTWYAAMEFRSEERRVGEE